MGSYDQIIEFNNTAQLADEGKSCREKLENDKNKVH